MLLGEYKQMTLSPIAPTNYEFTNSWFESSRSIWDNLIPQINPVRILEIGSYEGASTCYLIEKLAPKNKIEIHCIDSWGGGIEHQIGGTAISDMNAVEQAFLHNTKIASDRVHGNATLNIHKGYSDFCLSKLISNGKQGYFDFIYIDGSHQSPDVLCDAVLSFRLLKKYGVIIFDDYLWSEALPYGIDPIRCPKIAIDSFTNIYCRKIKIISAPLYQLYIQKIED